MERGRRSDGQESPNPDEISKPPLPPRPGDIGVVEKNRWRGQSEKETFFSVILNVTFQGRLQIAPLY